MADRLTIGEVSRRSGVAASALRFYEREGLIGAERTSGGQRRFARNVLRRLAFIRAAQHVGLTLNQVKDALSKFYQVHFDAVRTNKVTPESMLGTDGRLQRTPRRRFAPD